MRISLRLLPLFSLLIMACQPSNATIEHEVISLSEKKIILSSIVLKNGVYYFDEQKAKDQGLSDAWIAKMKKELKTVNADLEAAKKLPNSTIEWTDPKDIDLDELME